MAEQLEDFGKRLDLSLHLELDLAAHEGELGVHFVAGQVTADADELAASVFDLAIADQLSRGIGHERRQTDEQYNAPGDLDAQRQAPLRRPVRCVTARKPDPVGRHGPQRNPAAGDATDEATIRWSRDLAEIDRYRGDESTSPQVSLDVANLLLGQRTPRKIQPERDRRGTCPY